MIDPWEEFANAIVLQAVKDYQIASYVLKWNRMSGSAKVMKEDSERFFISDWFTKLTGVNGELILKRLKEEESA